jgi:Gpi18-like mannosyltransferase
MPYLVFDIALSILFFYLINDEKKALLAFKLWIANPISIYICYVMGQFDIIPAFFLMLALYFFKKRRELSCIVSIGISAAFKLFGLLFLPPMAIIYSKEHAGLKSKAKHLSIMLIIGALPLVVSQIATLLTPTYYESANLAWPVVSEVNGFYGKTFYIMGQGGNVLNTSLFYLLNYSTSLKTVSFDTIYLVILIYGLFLLGVTYFANWSLGKVWKSFLVFLLAYYAFSLFHPQWFLLGLPLLILLVSEDRSRYFGIYVLLVSLFFVFLGYWNDFFTSIFIPIIHQAYFWQGEIDTLNGLGLQGYQIISIFRSLLSAVCIVLIGFILKVDRLFQKSKAA